ncbi:TPA: type VI secretion system membrane subunit TssM [Klebsiella oxytoca]|uniref:Type VI secretion system membrane subunit TssM n=1 Tax=Klebsiella oxytoca TaxID=571 RepID=A0AAN5LB93_KLEOX|nr:type VI secretion system membrane subunit TssM [Klebsiella oxytoca]
MLKTVINYLRSQLPKLKFSWLLAGLVLWSLILVVVWWRGTSLEFFGVHLFERVRDRVWFTLVWLWLACVVSIWLVWRKRRQIKARPSSQVDAGNDPLQASVEAQQQFLDSWLQAFCSNMGAGALWSLPWYLMLGMPGSGKSSLVHRANTVNKLNARLMTGLRTVAREQKVDCWLGEEAVIVDPDGELFLQAASDLESEGVKNERLWQHLLDWLNTRRKRQPLNGVVVTLDLGWLSSASVAERKACAQLLRSRLRDISATLNTRLPVYLVLTRLDMLNGFSDFFQHLDKETRQSVLGITFNPQGQDPQAWMVEFNAFWERWIAGLNDNLADKMFSRAGEPAAARIFSFVRQLAGLKDYLGEMFVGMIPDDEGSLFCIRGVYLSSVYQQGVPFDAFVNAASRRYRLPDEIYPAARGESTTFFVRDLFRKVIFPEAYLAGESRLHSRWRRRRMSTGAGVMVVITLALIAGWQHFYRVNERAGQNVLARAQQFMATRDVQEKENFGVSLLPRLNLIREAALSSGDYREKHSMFADMGLYQGDRTGPYVEGSYLQLLQLRFLPAVMAGLADDLRHAAPSSEDKLSVLRVMRMIEDASGRNKPLVEQFMSQRWQKAFPEQGAVQESLMQHLKYALDHTDWQKAQEDKETKAIAAWAPFVEPVKAAQRELSKLPLFQRVYQSMVVRARDTLPPDLLIRDEVGQSFDGVFTLRDREAGSVPRFFTWSGFNDDFLRQEQALFDLTAQDAWVLGLRSRVQLSEADRLEIQRQVNDRYITDYVNRWQKVLAGLDVQTPETPEQALALLTTVTSNAQPFRRVLASLSDNTRTRAFPDRADAVTRSINMRIARPFMSLNDSLTGRGENAALIQEVNQKLTDLLHWLEQTVNADDPGSAALKVIQQRQTNPWNDPTFTLQQYARGLPAPLNRWVGQIAGQISDLTVNLALSSLNEEWRSQVVEPFNEQFASRYPFDPTSQEDVSLSDMERFFAAGGTLDRFCLSGLKPLMDAGVLKSESGSDALQELQRQLARAQLIRQTLFNAQGTLEVHFVVEPIELTANKRRSVLNIDGQLVEYAHGRRQKIPLVWPNTLRDGAESKLTLVPDGATRSPRSVSFSGPWAMFRLVDSSVRTRNNYGSFDARFTVDNGSMTYRFYSDESDSPFSSGLFSQFRLPGSLY